MVTDTEDNKMKMSESIAKAILAIMSEIPVLEKDQENKHGKYDYASADSFNKAIAPLLVKNNLLIVQEELSSEIISGRNTSGSDTVSTQVKWAFTFYHTDGSQFGPIHRTVTVPQVSAQAHGSAQTYALKHLMKGQFHIRTGEPDGDDAAEPMTATAVEPAKTDIQIKADRIRDKLKSAKTAQDLREAWDLNDIALQDVEKASLPAFKWLEDLYDRRLQELEENE